MVFVSLMLVSLSCGGKDGKGGAAKGSGPGLMEKAEACHAEARYDCAMESYATLLKLKPREPELLNRFAMAARLRYYVTGDADFRDQELDALRRAVRRAPESSHAQVNLGTTLWEMGMHEEASEAYQAALKLEPGHPDAALIKERIRSAAKDEEEKPGTKGSHKPRAQGKKKGTAGKP